MIRNIMIAAICLCLISPGQSHAVLKEPKAREGMAEGLGEKVTPRPPTLENLNACLGKPAGPPVATYCAGEEMKVKWEITLDHPSDPGVRIALGYPDAVRYEEIVSGIDVHDNEATITLPKDRECDNCVLHWMWDSIADNGYYIGCSDIAIELSGDSCSSSNSSSNSTSNTNNAPAAQSPSVLLSVAIILLCSILTLF